MNNYDVIIAGAGSIGVPTAMALGELGVKTLVLDRHPSPGQGENKHAIGGVRATHSDPAKIVMCLRSLEIYATWRETHGDDIEWLRGGYLFPVYREKEEASLKGIMPIQKKYGLDIDFVGPESVEELIPGITTEGLIGGTFSPNDGSLSPMMAVNAFYRRAVEKGVRFEFKKEIEKIRVEGDKVTGVVAGGETYNAPILVDAAGPHSKRLSRMAGADIAVTPDSHEGAITEPVKRFFKCMVVDLRPGPGSNNYYFYQNRFGQVIFCLTPDPPIIGTDTRETSSFLPLVCARMVKLVPRLQNIRVRRMWRGLYPMSPDGFPLFGWNREVGGLFHATGMCGQGLMIGPGAGEVAARMITDSTRGDDKVIIEQLSPYRDFSGGGEALK